MSTRVSAHASLIKRLRLHLKTEGYSPSIQRSYPTLAGHFLDYCENKHLSPDAGEAGGRSTNAWQDSLWGVFLNPRVEG